MGRSPRLRFLSVALATIFVGLVARADPRATAPRPPVAPSIVARVVALEIYDEDSIVTIAAGTDEGIARTWRARFREGTTTHLLAGGDAILIRTDHRTTVLKTKLTPAQVRANRFVQLDP